VAETGQVVALRFTGRLDAFGAARIWSDAIRAAATAKGRGLAFDLGGVSVCDTSGAALLRAAEAAHGGRADLRGADARVVKLLERVRYIPPASPQRGPAWRPVKDLGSVARSLGSGIAFIGEATLALGGLPTRRRMLRIADLLGIADQAGTRAVPLVILLGYLMGLILAFQSLIPMRQFGADIYVINLVSISLLRELGALLAAVILAGRTGSAFAAELGTMKVNEEIAALSTMGLDPVTMLVLPRLIASAITLPALALALDLAGLVGMGTVMMAFGFPPIAIVHQIAGAAHVRDLLEGLFKAFVFGMAIAAIGCRAGLATGVGPRAVGLAATSAVVGGIVSTIVLDGLFALAFYRLGL
jgi:phospholipid/cholesterol/gamma-HCH transport system permease protein